MKRISLFILVGLGFMAISACQRRGLENESDYNPANFVLSGADHQLYKADCLGKAGDVAINSNNASGCRVSASSSGRQAAYYGGTANYSVFNSDMAVYFCMYRFPRNAYACMSFFGVYNYQPQPTYQTCNSCVNCPFGGLCPRYCFTTCANPMPIPVPQPYPYPTPFVYPTPTPTPNPNQAMCPQLRAQVMATVNSFSYCRVDSDCQAIPRLADSCADYFVNAQFSRDPMVTQPVSIYNQVCKPTTQVICTMMAMLPTCQNNRCNNGLTY